MVFIVLISFQEEFNRKPNVKPTQLFYVFLLFIIFTVVVLLKGKTTTTAILEDNVKQTKNEFIF